MENNKPTTEQFIQAAATICRMVPFGPKEPEDIAAIALAMEQYVETIDQLEWLRGAVLNHFREWSGAIAIRELFASRFRPKDEDSAQLRGMEPELRHAIECGRQNDRKVAEWKTENQRRLLAGEVTPEEIAPPVELVQAAVKTIPKASGVALVPEYLRNAVVPPPDRQEHKTLAELEGELEFLKRPARSAEETAQLIRLLETKLGIQKQTVQ